jgi:hypothetical protein
MLLALTKNSKRTKSMERTMKILSQNLTLLGILGLGLFAGSAPAQYSDSFEGPLNSGFWSTEVHSGYVVCPSSTRAHTGNSSVELVTTDTADNKNVRVYHSFGAPTYGTVSFWVYDTAAGFASANSITFQVSRGSSWLADLWTPDYGSPYMWGALGSWGPTTVPRTQDWHQFTISCQPDSLTLKIDDIIVHSEAGGQQFDRVDMILSAPSWRPTWSMQFDDFQFTPAADTQPPEISAVTVTPAVLWPPNHRMVDVEVDYTVEDDTDPVSSLTSTLSVTSNEPPNGRGDGNTSRDWEVVNPHLVRLRAERAGTGNGRVYTITVTCTDTAGNSASKDVTVLVPKR